MPMIPVLVCPLCKSPNMEIVNPPEQVQTLRSWWGCQECNLLFQSPHPTMEENAEEYIKTGRPENYPTLHDRVIQLNRAERQIEVLKIAGMEKATYALDFGAAGGTLLEEFRNEWGCEVLGIEYNETEFVFAAKKDIALVKTLDDIWDEKFDLFSMSHFLEHVDKPVEYLANVREKYAMDGAFLMVEVPSFAALSGWADYHMVIFSPVTLEKTLEAAGWEVEGGRIIANGTIIQVVGRNDSSDNTSEGRESGNSEEEHSPISGEASDSLDD